MNRGKIILSTDSIYQKGYTLLDFSYVSMSETILNTMVAIEYGNTYRRIVYWKIRWEMSMARILALDKV